MTSTREIIAALTHHRFPLTSEKECQQAVADALTTAAIEFTREYRLSDTDIPDFKIGGIVLEIKLKGSKAAIYRQCKRYCEYEEVESLILASNVSMGLPNAIMGKPAILFHLGRGWL